MGELTTADLLWIIPVALAGGWTYGFVSAAVADWREHGKPTYQFPTPWQHFNVCPCGNNTKTTDVHYTFAWHPCPECGAVAWEKDVVARRWSDGRFERLPACSDGATLVEEVSSD